MIYAIILIILGLLMIVLNKKEMSLKATIVRAWLSIPYIVWGTGGIVILNTIRFSVFHEKPTYWVFLILGSALEIIMGGYLIFRYFATKRQTSPNASQLFLYQNILGIGAIALGIATALVA